MRCSGSVPQRPRSVPHDPPRMVSVLSLSKPSTFGSPPRFRRTPLTWTHEPRKEDRSGSILSTDDWSGADAGLVVDLGARGIANGTAPGGGGGGRRPREGMGRWSKDKRDIYYRKAKEEGWRARSAYKLMQIDDQFDILKDVKHVVDLCAAPGSWSQVLSRKVYLPALEQGREPPKLVAIDMQPMTPIEGVIQMRGDITCEETAMEVIRHFDGMHADLVLSDGAPDVTGLHDFDEYIQAELVRAALWITTHVLRTGGNFVAKIFRGKDIAVLYAQLGLFFDKVTCAKPRCCRNSSVEAFVVCQGYAPPQGFERSRFKELLATCESQLPMDGGEGRLGDPWEAVVPFVLCKDHEGWDPDQSYELPDDGTYVQLHPVQPPIAPAYKTAIEREGRQVCGGDHGGVG